MAEIICYIYIFHLTWLMSLHYLVKGGCSKFYLTLDLLQSDCSDLVSKWRGHTVASRDNFFAQRPLPDMTGDDFLNVSTGRHPGASARDVVAFLERDRDARNASSSRRLCPCTRCTFQARFWADLSWQLITLLNKTYSVYCVLIQSSDTLLQIIHFNVM